MLTNTNKIPPSDETEKSPNPRPGGLEGSKGLVVQQAKDVELIHLRSISPPVSCLFSIFFFTSSFVSVLFLL